MRSRIRGIWPCLIVVAASGCIDRARVNSRCEWTADTAFALDLRDPAQRRHLVADAQLAEELAVRYADTEHKRRFGFGGHGRLIEHGLVLHRCFDALVERIGRDHGVAAAAIDEARRQRDRAFDIAVSLPFTLFYLAVSAALAVRIQRRFVSGGTMLAGAVILAASAAASALGVQLGVVWTAIWESVRIGNDHFGSFRAAVPPWSAHPGALFAGGVVLFWIAAAIAFALAAGRTQ